ncbi:MAG: proline/glycine betaine ABC transporter permease [Spirochaetaceae bacterium]|nr:MAG: proline/glycine betaine ABC transporter permease [Spirochaetaceae bacterium]
MRDFPEWIRFPVADRVDLAMRWVLNNLGWFFDWVGDVGLRILISVERALLFIPWWVAVIGVGVLAWRVMGSKRSGIAMAVLLFMVGAFGYWTHAMNTLSVVIVAVAFSITLGIPLGILMAWNNTVRNLLTPILDAMQTMPSFVYLIPALMLFGLGRVPATFATVIYAIPPVIRLTNVGIREVPPAVIEASTAFGAGRWNLLFDVQLPLARPSIMVGVNQTTMMALAMVVIGSMIGNRGLGMEVLLAINRVNIGQGFEAGISIVFLAIIIDRITTAFAKAKRVEAATGEDAETDETEETGETEKEEEGSPRASA